MYTIFLCRQAPSLGPGVNVACCCHDSLFPNAPNGQFCCCSGAGNSDVSNFLPDPLACDFWCLPCHVGDDSKESGKAGGRELQACCNTGNSFCEQENCTAIMVGSLLIGSVVISSCFVAFWFFRVRTLRHHVNALQMEATMTQGVIARSCTPF